MQKKKAVVRADRAPRIRLASDVRHFAGIVSAVADARGVASYLVGGLVRDLSLGGTNDDLDILIEGPAIEIAREVARRTGGRCVEHEHFATATVLIPEVSPRRPSAGGALVRKIDLASARTETYPAPAALPLVKQATITEDLFRRDFTINAMAIRLPVRGRAGIIDPFHGVDDLRLKRIRVLHAASFIDDPTRIFRAARFASRFGFKIESQTARLIRSALHKKILGKLQPDRLRNEVLLIMNEKDPFACLKILEDLGVLAVMSRRLRCTPQMKKTFTQLQNLAGSPLFAGFKKRLPDYRLLYIMALLHGLDRRTVAMLRYRLKLRASDEALLADVERSGRDTLMVLSAPGRSSRSQVFRCLSPYPPEFAVLMLVTASSTRAKKRIRGYLERDFSARLAITGSDLALLGLKPGPCYKKILSALLDAKIDRVCTTRADELRFARRLIKISCGPLQKGGTYGVQ
ncbi:MAG: hypothetical protein WCG78_03780 [Candidatus Omnitrophota bacterium]